MKATAQAQPKSRRGRACALAASALVIATGATVPALADHQAAGTPQDNGLTPSDPNPPPSISGTAMDGQTLTANGGSWPSNVTVSYRWIRCDADGVTNCIFLHNETQTYVLVPADVGKRIKVRVTGAYNSSNYNQVDTAVTEPVAVAKPPVESHPGNTGRAVVGGTLRGTSARFGYGTPPFSEDNYQWESCPPPEFTNCTPLPGATELTYTIDEGDIGSRLRLRERAIYGPNEDTVDAYSPNSPIVTVEESPPQTPRRTPTGARLLDPFPVIAVGGLLMSDGARLTLLRVRGPVGALVSVRCLGPRCARAVVRRTIGRTRQVRIRPLERHTAFGTRLIFRVTKPGLIGKWTRLRIRAGRRPTRVDRCLQPGASRPSPCPES